MSIRRVVRAAARRGASQMPPRLVRSFVAAVAPGNRPAIGLVDAQHIVVVAPHPDDESIGCGGVIALAARNGSKVTVVFVTDGEDLLVADAPGSLASRRRAQGSDACAILGARPEFLALPDGGVHGALDALTPALDRFVHDADLVLLPWFGDANSDHRAVNLAFANTSADVTVWGYEVWTPLPGNRVVDISDTADDKRRAIRAHTADPFIDADAVLGLNRYRAATTRMDGSYAEAFYEATSASYRQLTRDTCVP